MSGTASPLSSSPDEEPRLSPAAARFCAFVDCVNGWVGQVIGASVLLVSAMVIYEITARSLFGRSTSWSNEAVIYLSAMTYLLAGGYAFMHHSHVRIDIIYATLSPRIQAWLDAITFILFLLYTGTLIYIGGNMAWDSLRQHETTGSPWDPPIWPVKFTIMIAGVLLLLQGTANLLRKFASTKQRAS